MKKIALVAFCIVTLLCGSAMADDNVPTTGKIEHSAMTDIEMNCLKDYMKLTLRFDSILPSHADAIRSMMASGRYSACDIVGFVKDFMLEKQK